MYTDKIWQKIIQEEQGLFEVDKIVVEEWLFQELKKEQQLFYEMEGIDASTISNREISEVFGVTLHRVHTDGNFQDGFMLELKDAL